MACRRLARCLWTAANESSLARSDAVARWGCAETWMVEARACRRFSAGPAGEASATAEKASPGVKTPGGMSGMAAFGLLAAGLGCYAYFQYSISEKRKATQQAYETSVGEAQVGGDFELTDTAGKKFSSSQLHGEFSLLYFGFTHCPDICPDELEKMAKALDEVEATAGIKLQPVFISIDPDRDSAKLINSYVKEFHPRMIGLRGTMEEVRKVAKLYRVYFMRTNDTNDYLVDHSIIMYLLNPEGKFVTFYGKSFTADEIATSLVGHARAWRSKHPEYKIK